MTHPPEQIASQLSLEEAVSLLSGRDFWSLPGVPRFEVGSLRVTDGPNGARGGGSLVGGVKAAAFPIGIALGATWDVELMREIGAALAQEVHSKGAHVLLGPTINIQRTQTNGRNFECLSEDPVLTGRLVAPYVAGLQEAGVSACPKHFVANEQETERGSIDSVVDGRTLRELYLVPFEHAIREGGAWSVMTAYNRLNGTFCSEHEWLLTDVLRRDWGFDGVVMSDWFGSHTTAASVNAGLDLEMPGPARDRGEKLVAAVEDGAVTEATVRASAERIVRLAQRTGARGQDAPAERAEDRPEHRALIRRAGAAGSVLLTNDGTLPLAGSPRIAVIGPNAKVAQVMGGGSSQINAHRKVSPWEGLVAAVGEDRLTYARGADAARFEPVITEKTEIEYFRGRAFEGEPVARETLDTAEMFWGDRVPGGMGPLEFSARMRTRFTPDRSGRWRFGLRSTGPCRVRMNGREVVEAWESWTRGTTFFEEGCDERTAEVDLEKGVPVEVEIDLSAGTPHQHQFTAFALGLGLPAGEGELEEAERVAGNADIAIVFAGRDATWDSEGADLPSIRLPRTQDSLIARVAAAAPRTVVVLQTGGPVEMPWLESVNAVLQAWYPGQEAGHAIADVLLGAAEPGGRLPQSFPRQHADAAPGMDDPAIYPGKDGAVRYAEGLFIGYRHHDRAGTPPLFPFGHGLSYADIALDGMTVDTDAFEAEGRVDVVVRLRNRANRAGSQVVQLYVEPLDAPIERPIRELKGFAKVELGPSREGEARISLRARDFAYWDDGGWTVAPGRYRLRAALSAADDGLTQDIERSRPLRLDP